MAMIGVMALTGVAIAPMEVVFFGLVTAICLVGTVHFVTSISGERATTGKHCHHLRPYLAPTARTRPSRTDEMGAFFVSALSDV